jgi:predicted kinase
MKYLIMLIGLPGSGKTTLAQKIVERYGCDFFSSEMVGAQIDRYQSVKEDRDFSEAKQEEIYEKLAVDVFSSLQTHNAVVEGVFRSENQRGMIDAVYRRMKEIREDLTYLKFWITCDTQVAIERINRRKQQGTISPAGVNTFWTVNEEYEIPTEDEGFVIVDNSASIEAAFESISSCIDERIGFSMKQQKQQNNNE